MVYPGPLAADIGEIPGFKILILGFVQKKDQALGHVV